MEPLEGWGALVHASRGGFSSSNADFLRSLLWSEKHSRGKVLLRCSCDCERKCCGRRKWRGHSYDNKYEVSRLCS